MIDYILEIEIDPSLEDETLARLYLTSSTGSTTTDAGAQFVIQAYFDSVDEREAAKASMSDLAATFRTVDRPRVDWLEKYQQSLQAMEIGARFIVAPSSSLIDGQTRLPIVIPQEQAFGTGSHETTSLCLELLEELDLRGTRGLDIGSGSGILAIAMVRLGARRAIAFDNDLDAYGPLRENRIRNDIDSAALPLFLGTLDAVRSEPFDVVTMNIIPEVIVPLLPSVKPLIGGFLILSGVLLVKRDDVHAAASSLGLSLHGEKSKGEWWAGCYRF